MTANGKFLAQENERTAVNRLCRS